MYKLDEEDKKIINELGRNARISYRKLAKKLGLATSTVIHKYERMRAAGIIKGSSIIVDSEKAGYNLLALIEIIVSKGKLVEVEEKIAKRPNVYAVYDITGDTDAMMMARFRSRKELNDFVKGLLAMDFVERTNTHFVLNVVKEDFRVNM